MVAAIGDSDTAAFAANSGGPFTYFTEYWGASFSTGTDGSWRSHPTLANLLQACNKLLIGGSSGRDSVICSGARGQGFGGSSGGCGSTGSGGREEGGGRGGGGGGGRGGGGWVVARLESETRVGGAKVGYSRVDQRIRVDNTTIL